MSRTGSPFTARRLARRIGAIERAFLCVDADVRVDLSEDLTPQSRPSSTLSGSPPHGKLLIPLNGEMSEWLKEHAWKAKRASNAKPLRDTSKRNSSAT